MPLISVIIPVYNSNKYLTNCIESIINQTFSDIEIIIINDGSTDNCQRIIDEYSEKDSRIISVVQENQGQSVARNKGIQMAKGKYISFIDSDDIVDITMLEKMYKLGEEEDLDIVVCGVEVTFESSNVCKFINNCGEKHVSLDNMEFDAFIKEYYFGSGFLESTCNKIFRRSIVAINKIRFEDYKTIHKEDELFNLYFMPFAKAIGFINEPLYKYYRRHGSSSTSIKKNLTERYNMHMKALEHFIVNNELFFMNNLLYYKYLYAINDITTSYNCGRKITFGEVCMIIKRYIEVSELLCKTNYTNIRNILDVSRLNKKSFILIIYHILIKLRLEKCISILQFLKIKLVRVDFS